MNEIYQLVDSSFKQDGIQNASETAMPFIVNSRVNDKAMLAQVPFLGQMSSYVFCCANEKGIHFIAYYPKNGIMDTITSWTWNKINYLKWENKRRFSLYVQTEDKEIDLVCIQKDKERANRFEQILQKHFHENGKNKAMLYPGENLKPGETFAEKLYAPSNYEKKVKKHQIKTTFNTWRTRLGIVVIALMIAYIIGKGVLKLF